MTDIARRLSAALVDRYLIEREPELAAVFGAERFVQEIKTTAGPAAYSPVGRRLRSCRTKRRSHEPSALRGCPRICLGEETARATTTAPREITITRGLI